MASENNHDAFEIFAWHSIFTFVNVASINLVFLKESPRFPQFVKPLGSSDLDLGYQPLTSNP